MKDLTKGYPAKIILLYTLPLMLGNILQQLYNLTDSKIVSMFVGTDALAAVGNTGVVSMMVIGFINGLSQGYSIPVARCFGARDEMGMRRYVAGTIILSSLFTIVLTGVSLLIAEPCLRLLNTPDDIMAPSVSYLNIILAGMCFTSIYNVCANTLRAVGDSKHPLYLLIISIVLNIGFDYLFVGVFHWGIDGAAYATILAQAICAVTCIVLFVTKFKMLLPKKGEWKLTKDEYDQLLPIGFSMGFMSTLVNIGTVVLQGAINGLGTVYVTAHAAARRIFCILMCFIYTYGFAMTTYVSQNMGAGKYDRVRQGVRHATVIVTITSTILVIVCFLFGDDLIRFVVSTDDPRIVEPAVMYNQVGIAFFYVLGPLFILRCALQGMGKKSIPVISSLLELVIKAGSAFILVPFLHYFGVALTEPISWIAMTTVLFISYVRVTKKGLQNI